MSKTKNIFLFIFFLPFLVFAEYNGNQIKFSIKFKDGREIIGYNFLSTIYQKDKSVSYKAFLENNYELILRNQFNDSIGEFTYFKHRIKYDYTDYNGANSFIYTLIDKIKVDINKIEKFKIIELIDQSYAIGISSSHVWKDRIWMKIEPIEKYAFGGILCSHDIFIHNKNDKTDRIIRALKAISISFEKELNEQREIMDRSDGTYYYEAKDKIEQIEEEIDDKISEELQNFNGMNVVIITMCSC